MKARGEVANVATVRLKRLQHKQRRKVDTGQKWTYVQETQTANASQQKNVEDQRGARADAGLSSPPNVYNCMGGERKGGASE